MYLVTVFFYWNIFQNFQKLCKLYIFVSFKFIMKIILYFINYATQQMKKKGSKFTFVTLIRFF